MKLWSALTGRWQLWRSGLFLFGGGCCNDKLLGRDRLTLESLTTGWADRTGQVWNEPAWRPDAV